MRIWYDASWVQEMSIATAQFIHIGQFADLDPDETNYSSENPTPILQSFSQNDITTTEVTQNDANNDGLLQENDNGQTADTFTYDVGNGPITSGLDNVARYSANYVDENGTSQSTTVSVYQTENGDVFVKFPNDLQISSMEITGKVADGYSSITQGTSSSSRVVCFALGTYIQTPDGHRKIETLRVGDLVVTLDHGERPIRWIHRAKQPLNIAERDAKPVLIEQGALGTDRPNRDLVVSPQHRILLGGSGQLENTFPEEVLAPAKALTTLQGIRHMNGKRDITWVHFAFDKHEAVYANGCVAESLLFGPMVLNGLSDTQRLVLLDMYGPITHQNEPLNGPEIRRCASIKEIRQQLHIKSKMRSLRHIAPIGSLH